MKNRFGFKLVSRWFGISAIALALHACGGGGGSAEVVAEKPAGKAVSVNLLHVNDHHSYFEGQAYELQLDYDPANAGSEKVRVDLGGFPRIVNLIRQYRDKNSILLSNGEVNGTLYFSLYKGEVDIKVLNALNLDAYQIGNHEFDEGEKRLAELIEMATFPILGANIHPTAASPLASSRILPYVIKEIDGEKVAIIGVLKVEKTRESSMVTDAVKFTEEISTVRDQVKSLTDQKINKIIVLSHLGYDFDQKLAASVEEIDVIVGGDTHTRLDSTGELSKLGIETEGAYPTVVNNPKGKPVYIVQAWEYAKALGRLQLDFDAQGQVVRAQGNIELPVGQPYEVLNASKKYVPASADQVASISSALSKMKIVRQVEPDPSIQQIIDPYKQGLEKFKKEVIGKVAITMPFTRIPAPFASGTTPNGSFAAQAVVDAFLSYLPKAQVGIQNAGGVRGPFNEGEFTTGDAYTILPFSNTVVTVDMKGSDIVQVLEEALSYSQGVSGSTGAFPYASHLRYDVVLGAPLGQGIKNVEVKDRKSGNWSPIDLQKTYAVATNVFTAQGKDGYLSFARVRAANPAAYQASDVAYVIPIIEYFRKYLPGNILPPLNPAEYCIKSVTNYGP